MTDQIRVVIVDDSVLVCRLLTKILERDSAIQVVGTAHNGHDAIRMVSELRPNVVTMDVQMPGMDGLETTEHLMAFCPTPILVLTATLQSREVDITFKMLGAGALEVVEKPRGSDIAALERSGNDLIRRIKVLSRVKVVTHLRGRRRSVSKEASNTPIGQATLPLSAQPPSAPQPIQAVGRQAAPLQPLEKSEIMPIIVIGASTGGPRVVHRILSDLPVDLPAVIVVVQHIAEGFSDGMTDWLGASCKMPVRLAKEGHILQLGEVLIVPDQYNLIFNASGRIHLTQSPILLQQPSVDITMQSAAEIFDQHAIGVLLTGMGRDGAHGLLAIRRHRGYTIAQDEASCAIYGMPRAAVQLGAAQECLTPAQIGPRLVTLARRMLAEQSDLSLS